MTEQREDYCADCLGVCVYRHDEDVHRHAHSDVKPDPEGDPELLAQFIASVLSHEELTAYAERQATKRFLIKDCFVDDEDYDIP